MLLGLAGTIVCVSTFGFSSTFTMALTARFMWGLLNGNVGVGKTFLAEVSDDSNQARAFAVLGMLGGVGRLTGPAIGGFLAEPAEHPENKLM